MAPKAKASKLIKIEGLHMGHAPGFIEKMGVAAKRYQMDESVYEGPVVKIGQGDTKSYIPTVYDKRTIL
jgi:hypothetical protein